MDDDGYARSTIRKHLSGLCVNQPNEKIVHRNPLERVAPGRYRRIPGR